MTGPKIVVRLSETHPRPLYWLELLCRLVRKIDCTWVLRILNREQIPSQGDLENPVPETAVVQIRPPRGIVDDKRRIDRIRLVVGVDVRQFPGPRVDQRSVIGPFPAVEGIGHCDADGAVAAAGGADRVVAVE